jgi:hypothetical protein
VPPSSSPAFAGMRRHADESHMSLPCSAAALSFVSCIRLLNSASPYIQVRLRYASYLAPYLSRNLRSSTAADNQ